LLHTSQPVKGERSASLVSPIFIYEPTFRHYRIKAEGENSHVDFREAPVTKALENGLA
jgi:hypothetical protein